MFIGKLDRRIIIQQNTPTQDTYGEPIASWSTFSTVWAEKLKPQVAEKYVADQFSGTEKIVWRIRYLSGVNNLMRVSYDGKIYDIHGVYEEGRNKYMFIVTELIL